MDNINSPSFFQYPRRLGLEKKKTPILRGEEIMRLEKFLQLQLAKVT